MGTDINICLEKRTASGTWERVEPRLGHKIFPGRFRDDTLTIHRNRDLWDLLAFGVMIERRGEVVEQFVAPVARPRGIPEDATPDTRMEYEAQKDRSFGFNWLLVSELEAYDWGQEVIHTTRRYLDADGPPEPEWQAYGEPYQSSDGRPLQDYIRKPGTSYREAVRHFLDVTLPELQAIGPSDHVRVIFWFW